MKEFNIGSYTIGLTQKPFIIAEMSGNHNQSLERALKIIDVAAESGAHAIKLQTYTADTITIKGTHIISDSNSLWYGAELYDLYKQAYTPWEWHKLIFERATQKGMVVFSSPFDETAVDFLETLNVPVYKIASFENTHIPLIKKIAKTGKPVILSTGVSTISDIDLAVMTLRNNGCENFILLKCTSTYPSTPENSNVLTLPHLSQLFGCYVGLSDHTMGIGASIAAVALGARVIEKHFTLNRSDGGVDSAFSLEPHEFKSLVIETERAFQSLGTVKYGVQLTEEKSKLFKRSIFISKDIKKGEIFTIENLKIIRPSYGLHPKYYEMVLGRKCKIDLTAGTPLTIDCLID